MWALSAGLLDQPMCLPEDFSLNATDHEDDHHRRLGGGAGETWAATLRTLMLFLMMSPGNFWGGGLSPSYYTAKCSLEAILKAGLGALQLSEVFCWFIDNKQRMFPGLTWMVTCDLCEFARAGESPQRHHLSVNSFPKDVEKHLLPYAEIPLLNQWNWKSWPFHKQYEGIFFRYLPTKTHGLFWLLRPQDGHFLGVDVRNLDLWPRTCCHQLLVPRRFPVSFAEKCRWNSI